MIPCLTHFLKTLQEICQQCNCPNRDLNWGTLREMQNAHQSQRRIKRKGRSSEEQSYHKSFKGEIMVGPTRSEVQLVYVIQLCCSDANSSLTNSWRFGVKGGVWGGQGPPPSEATINFWNLEIGCNNGRSPGLTWRLTTYFRNIMCVFTLKGSLCFPPSNTIKFLLKSPWVGGGLITFQLISFPLCTYTRNLGKY